MTVAVKNAKRSTNARGRGPKAADQKGAIGSALATHILHIAEEDGKREIQAQISRKELLSKIMDFRDNAEHVAFRQTLTAKLDEIKKSADAAKISLNAYTDANPIAATQRVAVSRWTKLSEAVEKGYSGSKVDMDKPWPEIEKAATAHLSGLSQSQGVATKNAGPKQKKAGRKAKPMMAKVEEFIKTTMRDPVTNAPLPKDNRNLAEVVGKLLEDATLQETEEVAAVVQRTLEIKRKLAAESEAKVKAASDKAKAEHDKAVANGTPKTRKAAAGKTRKAKAERPSAADALIEAGKKISARESNLKQGRYSTGRVPH